MTLRLGGSTQLHLALRETFAQRRSHLPRSEGPSRTTESGRDIDELRKPRDYSVVIPAEAGIQTHRPVARRLGRSFAWPVLMGPGLRRGDEILPMRGGPNSDLRCYAEASSGRNEVLSPGSETAGQAARCIMPRRPKGRLEPRRAVAPSICVASGSVDCLFFGVRSERARSLFRSANPLAKSKS
jgi:hypothetical protein